MSNEQQNSVPYHGMREAFEIHYGQSFVDRDWFNESSVWAAAWKAAKAHDTKAQQEPPLRYLSDEEVFSVAREFLSESDSSVTDVISCARAILAKAREKV